jgi:hypothetical protein
MPSTHTLSIPQISTTLMTVLPLHTDSGVPGFSQWNVSVILSTSPLKLHLYLTLVGQSSFEEHLPAESVVVVDVVVDVVAVEVVVVVDVVMVVVDVVAVEVVVVDVVVVGVKKPLTDAETPSSALIIMSRKHIPVFWAYAGPASKINTAKTAHFPITYHMPIH